MKKEAIIPVLKVKDEKTAIDWYSKLGFELEGVYRHEADFPAYIFMNRKGQKLHLSEHEGDGVAGSLVYMYVEDLDHIANNFNTKIILQPWGREVHLKDPFGNRIRLGEF